MQAVMITMAGREDSALATAGELKQAGVATEIFVQPPSWPVGGEGNNKNSRRALKWALEQAAGDGILFVEDDLVVKPERFKRALASARSTGELMYFYMHDVPGRMGWYPQEGWIKRMAHAYQYRPNVAEGTMSDVHPREGPRLMAPDARIFGSQCVYIPMPYLRFLYAHLDQSYEYSDKIKSSPGHAMDSALNNWRLSNKLPAYVYLPHPVQHTQNRKLRGGKRRDVYSRSFDLVSEQEVESGV